MVGHAGSRIRTVYVDVTLTQSKVKVKVTGLLKLQKLPRIAHSLLRTLSREFKLREMLTLHEFQMAIFPYCLRPR